MASRQTPFQVLASVPDLRQTPNCQHQLGHANGSAQALAAALQVHTCSLTVLRRLIHVVTDEYLRDFMCEVFNDKALRDRVLLDVPDRVSGLVLRMESAAHRVYKQSRSRVRTTEALYCATLVARLREILFIREQQLGPMPGAWRAWASQFAEHMGRAIDRLEQYDSSSAWLMRWLVASPGRMDRAGHIQCSFESARDEAAVAWAIAQVHIVWVQTLAMDPEFEAPPFIRTRS